MNKDKLLEMKDKAIEIRKMMLQCNKKGKHTIVKEVEVDSCGYRIIRAFCWFCFFLLLASANAVLISMFVATWMNCGN